MITKIFLLAKPRIILFAILFTCCHGLLSQPVSRYNTFSYNVNEGLLQSTIGQIAIDKNNFCWISFPNGIQQFDGNNFRTIKIQPGLPDDKYAKFLRCRNGDLLISHSQGISKYEIEKNSFTHIYKRPQEMQRPVIFIGEDDGIIYFYDEMATITGMQAGSFKIISSVKTSFPAYNTESQNTPRFSENIIDHKVACWINKTICTWDLQNKKLLYRSSSLPGASGYFFHMLTGQKVIYANYNDNNFLQCLDLSTGNHEKILVEGKDKELTMARFNVLRWQGKYIVSMDDRVYETDSAFRVLRSEVVSFQNQPVAGNVTIADIVEDNFGNLYIQTVNGGIRKVIRNNYPIKYYGALEKDKNSVLAVLPDKKNNRILVGSNGFGLLIYDTLQQLVRHISKLPEKIPFFGISSIVKDNKGDYLLFISGEQKIWRLSADLSSLTSSPVSYADPARERGVNYFASPIFQDNNGAIVQSMYQLYRTDFASKKTTAHWNTGEYVLSRLWYDNKIISHANNELIFTDGQTFGEIKRIPFPNTGGVRCFARDEKGYILMGTNQGVFRIDISGKIIQHWTKEKGLPDDCIYAIVIDKNGNLWCSSNKGIFKIDTNNNILQLTREDGLQENEFNTGVAAATEDGELFLGGMNGVSSFYPSVISSFEEKIKMLVTRIRVNNADTESDSAAWNIGKLKLDYNQNSLSFDFVAMGNNNPAQYIYQYRMVGIDKEWIQNTGMQTIRYSLPPGKYTLQLYASRSFDKDAKPMKEVKIVIQPPFWKSWWFISIVVILLIGLLAYFINQRNKRKYAGQLQQLEQERRLKLERERIAKDLHDNLGAYANAIFYKTELLEQADANRTELISDLKFASKDIITSLRETVWALKKDFYSAEECLVRIRNFIQPFTRYYEHISFSVEGEVPENISLHYTKALNAVRIVQEAVSNSIKHAAPKNVKVLSGVAGNKWKITVTDDGKGFDYPAMKEMERGNGLNNIEHRAAESGFELVIQAAKDKGTTISIII